MSIAKIDQLKTSIDSKIRSLKLVDNINQSNSVAANKQHFFLPGVYNPHFGSKCCALITALFTMGRAISMETKYLW